jgi:hypothetical protein
MNETLTYTRTENRKFGITVGIAFLLLGAILVWRGKPTGATTTATVGAVLMLAGMVVPDLLGPVHKGWMKFALLISKVTTPIFMGLVYYLSVLPIGLVMRMLGKNPMTRGKKNPSFWVDRRADGALRSDLERQF